MPCHQSSGNHAQLLRTAMLISSSAACRAPTVLETNGNLVVAGACKPADSKAPINCYKRSSEE